VGHTLEFGPMNTEPMMTASGCTYADESIVGCCEPSA
jgi:hypothetical protein